MFRHGSLRDDRRRRSLVEDSLAASDSTATAKSRSRSAKATETYTELARSDFHARWSQFVPRRNWTLAMVLAAGVAIIAALEFGYHAATSSSRWNLDRLSALAIGRSDSLAGWFAALTLFATAVMAVFIYTVRRYRLDDYRGRYRLWLWSAVAWLVMSIDAIAGVRSVVQMVGIELSGRVGPFGGVAWWLGPWGLVLACLGLRMLFDVRACRTALACLLVSLTSWMGAVLVPHLAIPLSDVELTMLTAGLSMAGNWLLFFAHVAFARHVLLDAHGQLPVRERKPKPKKAAEPATSEKAKSANDAARQRTDLVSRVDPPHTPSSRPATSGLDLRSASTTGGNGLKSHFAAVKAAGNVPVSSNSRPAAAPAKPTSQFVGGYDDEDDRPGKPKLSRAERKRLRKQQRAAHGDDD